MRAVLIVNPNATSTTAAGARPAGARPGKPGPTHRRAHQPPGPRRRDRAGRAAGRYRRGHHPRWRRHGERGGQRPARGAGPARRRPGSAVAVVPGGSANVRPRAGHQPGPDGGHQPADRPARRARSQRVVAADRPDGLRRALGGVHRRDGRGRRRGGRGGGPARHSKVTAGRHPGGGEGDAGQRPPGADPDAGTAGREPVSRVYFAFISNSSPWTYANTRPVFTNPDTTFEKGLGVFAITSMNVGQPAAGAPDAVPQTPDQGPAPDSRRRRRVGDITATEPVASQVDGDFLGLRSEMTFRAVPEGAERRRPARMNGP